MEKNLWIKQLSEISLQVMTLFDPKTLLTFLNKLDDPGQLSSEKIASIPFLAGRVEVLSKISAVNAEEY